MRKEVVFIYHYQ